MNKEKTCSIYAHDGVSEIKFNRCFEMDDGYVDEKNST